MTVHDHCIVQQRYVRRVVHRRKKSVTVVLAAVEMVLLLIPAVALLRWKGTIVVLMFLLFGGWKL